MSDFVIRLAELRDRESLVRFNRLLAEETEGMTLQVETLRAGIQTILTDASLGFYVVATCGDRVIGSLMITREWSDWRNGVFWWIQSVYVDSEYRRQGVFRQLYEHVQGLASQHNVCGFRLYVEKENLVAQNTYGNLGMHETPYKMFERTPASRLQLG